MKTERESRPLSLTGHPREKLGTPFPVWCWGQPGLDSQERLDTLGCCQGWLEQLFARGVLGLKRIQTRCHPGDGGKMLVASVFMGSPVGQGAGHLNFRGWGQGVSGGEVTVALTSQCRKGTFCLSPCQQVHRPGRLGVPRPPPCECECLCAGTCARGRSTSVGACVSVSM